MQPPTSPTHSAIPISNTPKSAPVCRQVGSILLFPSQLPRFQLKSVKSTLSAYQIFVIRLPFGYLVPPIHIL